MKKNTKLIIMDLYGIISLGSYWDVTNWLAKKFHIDPKKIYAILYHKYFNRAAMGEITERELFTGALKELKIDMDWKMVRDKHLAFQIPNEPAIRLCQDLQKQGYIVLLLSKNIPAHFAHTKRHFMLKKYFKYITNTFDLGLPKSSKKTILWVMKEFKVKPAEIVFCDDQAFNLVEAKKIGIKTVLYQDFHSFKRKLLQMLSSIESKPGVY